MTLDRFGKKLLYQSFEQHAREQASHASDPTVRHSWELAADSWRMLIELISERCFCGRAAVGAKYYEGGVGFLTAPNTCTNPWCIIF